MKVFSTYLRILNKHKGSISLAMIIFVAMAVISVKSSDISQITEFQEEKIAVCVINQDEDTVLSDGLKGYMNEHTELLRENEVTNIEDALFFRQVEYVVIIPKGFYKDFLLGKKPKLESYYVENSYSAYCVENLINNYLSTFKNYALSFPDAAPETIIENTKRDMETECNVSIGKGNETNEMNGWMVTFFSCAAYAVLGVITMGITTVITSFKQIDVKRRTLCSPVSYMKINKKVWMGHGVFGLVVFGILVLLGTVLLGKTVFSVKGLYQLLNLFAFELCAMGIATLMSQFVSNSSAIAAVSNTISICLCFLGGCFVPLEYMSSTAKTVGSFTPAYWYSKATENLYELSEFRLTLMGGYFKCLAIEVGFAIAFFSIALLVEKQKTMGKWKEA